MTQPTTGEPGADEDKIKQAEEVYKAAMARLDRLASVQKTIIKADRKSSEEDEINKIRQSLK